MMSSKLVLPVIIGFSLAIALAVGSGLTIYGVKQKPELFGLGTSTKVTSSETDKLVADVGKLIKLPADEKPTLATVTDVEKVKDQSLFKDAQNGDKVLVYTTAKKAILYRPTDNKIIEIGAINLSQQASSSATP
jgi:hypothetical protein